VTLLGECVGVMSIFTGYEHELHDRDRKFLKEISCLFAAFRIGIQQEDKEPMKKVDSLLDIVAENQSYYQC
jgi:hypothetical protein